MIEDHNEVRNGAAKAAPFYQKIIKMIFDLATYALIAYAVIVLIGQVLHFVESLGWFTIPIVAMICGAYVIRKLLIFLILRKK
jgi:phosphoglycerol transferase MdoB-like AlkP superfamily enzyme